MFSRMTDVLGIFSKNDINSLGSLLLALTYAPTQYRERALLIPQNALQEETVQTLREIAPAICLFYENLEEHETVTECLIKVTDEQNTHWEEKINKSFAKLEAGSTTPNSTTSALDENKRTEKILGKLVSEGIIDFEQATKARTILEV